METTRKTFDTKAAVAKTTVELGERTITLIRTIAAPRELVFRAWSEADQMARWFGPGVFTNRAEMDAVKGGAYRITMIGPDGAEYPMKGNFTEVTPPSRLGWTCDLSEHDTGFRDELMKNSGATAEEVLHTSMLVTFEEVEGGTRMHIEERFANNAVRDAYVKMGMVEGWSESFVKLDDMLAA